ncbi:MAG: hypothetical protein RLZZ142_2055 [Verrucomicrobiota bacterium]
MRSFQKAPRHERAGSPFNSDEGLLCERRDTSTPLCVPDFTVSS